MRKILDNIEEYAGVFVLSVMLLFAFANVLARYLFRMPFSFTEEIEVACLVWVTVLGASIGFKKGLHLGFGYITDKLSFKTQKIFFSITSFFMVITFSALLYISIQQMTDEISLSITTEALGIPQWIYTLSLPVGSALILWRIIESVIKKWKS